MVVGMLQQCHKKLIIFHELSESLHGRDAAGGQMPGLGIHAPKIQKGYSIVLMMFLDACCAGQA